MNQRGSLTRMPWRVAALLVATALCAIPAVAGKGSLSVLPLDEAHRNLQYKAAELYESGNVERALFIYKNDLAPLGDKYAQYMVGYMYKKGAGVAADPVLAAAWFRLAASGRGRSEFAEVAAASMRRLTPAEQEQADAAYLELSKDYSDVVVVLRQVQEDVAFLKQSRTRLPEGSQAITAGSRQPAGTRTERKTAEKRVSWCLEYLARELGNADYDVDWTELDVEALAADVDAWLRAE